LILPCSIKLRIPPGPNTPGVRLWGISFIVERETAQTDG
jgi:hypothetical protein